MIEEAYEVNDMMVESNSKMATMPVTNEYYEEYESTNQGGNMVAFCITIGALIVVGIVLGIIFGRKSALK